MESSQLLERWRHFRKRYPESAAEINEIICSLYAARQNQKEFDSGLDRLQDALSLQALQMLGVNTADKQALALWAQGMGLILLVESEQSLQ